MTDRKQQRQAARPRYCYTCGGSGYRSVDVRYKSGIGVRYRACRECWRLSQCLCRGCSGCDDRRPLGVLCGIALTKPGPGHCAGCKKARRGGRFPA